MSEGGKRVEIALDRAGGRFHAGERISGRVNLAAPDLAAAREVLVSLRWRAHEGEEEVVATARLAVPPSIEPSGELPGALPFSLDLPPGPVSYRGKLFRVEWSVVARVDLPLSFDPVEELAIEVLAPAPRLLGERAGYREPGQAEAVRPALGPAVTEAGRSKERLDLPVALGALGVGALSLVYWPAFVVIAPVALGYAAVSFYKHARDREAARRFGEPIIDLLPAEARRGQAVRVRVQLDEPSGEPLWEAHAELYGVERTRTATKNAQAPDGAWSCDLHLERVSLERVTEPLSRPMRLEGSLRIPEDAAPTFAATFCSVSWTVRVHLERRVGPRAEALLFDDELILHVQPG